MKTTYSPAVTAPRATTGARALRFVRRSTYDILRYIILVAVAIVILLPIVFGVLGGAKENGQLVGDPVALIPSPWVFSNYTNVLFGENSGAFWQELENSLMVAVVAVGLTVGLSSMAAFAFARMQFRGRELFYTLFTLGLLFPFAAVILPLIILINELGLKGSLLGVALPQVAFGFPLTIIILRPFFKSIPAELEDAAKIDGCSTFGFFWRILLPLARPALATVSVLAVVGTWNAFLLPLLVLNDAPTWTLPLGAMNFKGQFTSDQALTLAYTVTTALPAVIFYLFAERQLVSGLTAGSVKG